MLWQIKKLANIAEKPERIVLGLMSGTSLDGLDIALCRIENSGRQCKVDVIAFETMPFDDATKKETKGVFAKADAPLKLLCPLNISLASQHVQLIDIFLKKHDIDYEYIDLIASHGQTVYHDPIREPSSDFQGDATINSTLQIVDGDHIAYQTGVITISDFRQKHIAAGGEGAPLATYGDYLLFGDDAEARILLNLGGIANISYLPAGSGFDDVESTDTGPANTLLDAFIKKSFNGLQFDKDGKIAAKGTVIDSLLARLLEHSFFGVSMPKTTGPEEFSLEWLENAVNMCEDTEFSAEDIAATLIELTAVSIANVIKTLKLDAKTTIYASGGGIHNPSLMNRFRKHIAPIQVKLIDELGVQADAKEAVLFAILANECVAGHACTFKTKEHTLPNVSMGKICLPR